MHYDTKRWLTAALQLLDSAQGFITAAGQAAGPVTREQVLSIEYAGIRIADARNSIEEALEGKPTEEQEAPTPEEATSP